MSLEAFLATLGIFLIVTSALSGVVTAMGIWLLERRVCRARTIVDTTIQECTFFEPLIGDVYLSLNEQQIRAYAATSMHIYGLPVSDDEKRGRLFVLISALNGRTEWSS